MRFLLRTAAGRSQPSSAGRVRLLRGLEANSGRQRPAVARSQIGQAACQHDLQRKFEIGPKGSARVASAALLISLLGRLLWRISAVCQIRSTSHISPRLAPTGERLQASGCRD